MKKPTLISTLLIVASIMPISVFAQTTTPAPPTSATSAASAVTKEKPALMKDATEGEVRKVDKEAKRITLKHGPIKNLDMPGMTMVFQVKDAALLDKLAAGDKIMFTAEQQQGAMVVTAAEKVAPK